MRRNNWEWILHLFKPLIYLNITSPVRFTSDLKNVAQHYRKGKVKELKKHNYGLYHIKFLSQPWKIKFLVNNIHF